MSEPITHPDKMVARLVALASLLIAIGSISRGLAVDSDMEAFGWCLIAAVFMTTAYAGAVYRTRFWN